MMNTELKAAWVDALRSGKYAQGTFYLRDAQDRFCCLGVLCEISGRQLGEEMHTSPITERLARLYEGNVHVPSNQMFSDWGLDELAAMPLVSMNDNGAPFSEIAAAIEADATL